MNKFINLLIIFFILNIVNINAFQKLNDSIFFDKVYKKGIESVLLSKKGNELSFPIIHLDSDEQLTFMFDEIGIETHNYAYTLLHCDDEWRQSYLNPIEYIEGYEENNIDNYFFSQNTMVNYVNYSIDFPNDDIRPIISGNYILKVYEKDNPDNPVITKRFYVIEDLANVSMKIDKLAINLDDGSNQRLNIEIECDTEIENPSETVSFQVIKNHGTPKSFKNTKPSFVNGNKISFNTLNNIAYAGGKEYRHFDIKNFRFISDRIYRVEKDSINHVYLLTDEDLSTEDYTYKPDINGKRTMKLEKNEQSNIMADYCFVYFYLEAKDILQQGNYYVYADILGWDFQKNAKLIYLPEKNAFVTKLFLKQGYFNYIYVFDTKDELLTNKESKYKVEQNSHLAENDYHTLIYYKDYSSSYIKLIGYNKTNSTLSGNY